MSDRNFEIWLSGNDPTREPMTQEREARILEEAIEWWGIDHQLDMTLQAMAHLTEAIVGCKLRDEPITKKTLCEYLPGPLARLQVSINQLIMLAEDTAKYEIDALEFLEEQINWEEKHIKDRHLQETGGPDHGADLEN